MLAVNQPARLAKQRVVWLAMAAAWVQEIA
jgi:hypothetical protein